MDDQKPTVEELKDYLCMPDTKDDQYKGMLRLVQGRDGSDEFFWDEWLPARRGLATRH